MAFRNAIPLQWVVRPQHPDYGVDKQVQVFPAAGQDKVGIVTKFGFDLHHFPDDLRAKAAVVQQRSSQIAFHIMRIIDHQLAAAFNYVLDQGKNPWMGKYNNIGTGNSRPHRIQKIGR